MAERRNGCVRQETVAKQGHSGELNVLVHHKNQKRDIFK
jgi:hypothetical protein